MSKASKNKNNSKLEAVVKRVLEKNLERKWFSTISTSTAIDYSGTIASRTAIPLGDTDVTRDGDRAKLLSFEMRFDLLANVLVALVRVIVFQWHPPNGSLAPAIGNVLIVNGQAEAVHSPYSVDFAQHFTVLYDHIYQVDTNGTIGQGIDKRTGHAKIFSGFKPQMQFVAGATTGSNQIYSLFISDRTSTNLPLVRSVTMCRYTDA